MAYIKELVLGPRRFEFKDPNTDELEKALYECTGPEDCDHRYIFADRCRFIGTDAVLGYCVVCGYVVNAGYESKVLFNEGRYAQGGNKGEVDWPTSNT